MTQPHLFDPRTTQMPKCTYCDTTAKNACQHDADIAAGIRDPYTRRPRTCLNRHDPKEGRIPF